MLQSKEPGFLEEMAHSRTAAGNTQDEPGTFCNVRKKGNAHKHSKTPQGQGDLKVMQEITERPPNSQATQLKQQNKLILDYNPNYKINIDESIRL